MYLVNYDSSGNIKGFYIQGMHNNIPSPTVEISNEQHRDYFERGQSFKVVSGEFVYVKLEQQPQEIVTPPVDQSMADMWEALLVMSDQIEALKGGQ